MFFTNLVMIEQILLKNLLESNRPILALGCNSSNAQIGRFWPVLVYSPCKSKSSTRKFKKIISFPRFDTLVRYRFILSLNSKAAVSSVGHNVSFETLYSGQFTLSTQLIIPNYHAIQSLQKLTPFYVQLNFLNFLVF